ncbi:MAG: hypothetical protein COT81_02795 [Candidatus Buchananbacteria bacterium CG10_big_fil_rev_8_21_14_0_10_42_9]|uniref:(P)ppGpp synthetase n=1 Tax=Candidatus Buchananbacteria bacterium CG10_big_fil_rev_8_21_14_0_10_42_9 TaxID=1974526 RepID=A0A2H0W1F9_9BACT|nr:MAG: hypothetical protein COT81_02795 [Candidatus Buchananbacteria bacterium CG10_big_fil_rev_8_21_14_0_10_42_9]
MATINDLVKIVKRNDRKADTDMIRLAYDFAKKAHEGQKRVSGDPYIVHPLATAIILAKMKMDTTMIIAGLLHDVPEDTHYNLVDIEKNFGSEVCQLVTGVTKLGKLNYTGVERYAESLRRMFISMAQDLRVVVLKMADKLDNLKSLDVFPHEKAKRKALEALEIYAPIANRLSMGQIKGELEDLAFPHVYPEEYKWMAEEIKPIIDKTAESMEEVAAVLNKELQNAKIGKFEVTGRKKRLYSLYRKLMRPHYNRDISKIYDIVAIRIIVPSVADCYQTLGIIHKLWKPLPGRIKDYIAQPKPNGYRSLHTTVFSLHGRIAEFQIRTEEMHAQAEFGIAANWHYQEVGKIWKLIRPNQQGYHIPKKLKWVEEIVKWQKEIQDNSQFLRTIKLDAFSDRIFVFTPKGDVVDLPDEATVIDFAYMIHSDIGNHCVGALVNDQMKSVDTRLENGDVVKIITDKNRKAPSRDWLKFVKTSSAREKIRAATSHNG